jgi:hypothetical protein
VSCLEDIQNAPFLYKASFVIERINHVAFFNPADLNARHHCFWRKAFIDYQEVAVAECHTFVGAAHCHSVQYGCPSERNPRLVAGVERWRKPSSLCADSQFQVVFQDVCSNHRLAASCRSND